MRSELKILSEEGYKHLLDLAGTKPEIFLRGEVESELAKADNIALWSSERPLFGPIDELNDIVESGPGMDYQHSKILCVALGELKPAEYSDPLLWASLNCFPLSRYTAVRWKFTYRRSKKRGNRKVSMSNFVLSHWLKYDSDSRRANASARLFWLNELAGRIASASQSPDIDRVLKLLSGNVNVYHQMLSRPYIMANPMLMAKVCEIIGKAGNEHLKQTKSASDFFSEINTRGGAQALDLMNDDELGSLVNELLPPKDR